MATSGTMKINVVGDASKFNRTLGRTQRQLGALGGLVRKTSSRVAVGLAGAGAAAVAAAGKLARFGDEVADSAQKAGLGTERYQEMKFAFDELGVAAPDKAMQKFNRRIGEAAEGSGAAAGTIEDLGLSLERADGSMRDTGAVMDDAITKLAGIEDESRRAAAAGDLFGKKAGPELVAQLDEGGASVDELRQKAHDMGLVMDEEAIEASQEFSGAMDDLKNRALGLLRQGLTPVLTFISGNVIPFIENHVVPAFSVFSEWLGPKLRAAASIAQGAFDMVLSAARSVFDLIVRGDFTAAFGEAFNVHEDSDMVAFLLDLRDKAIEVADKVVTAFRRISDWWSENKDDIISGARDVRDAAIDMATKIHQWVNTHLMPPLDAFADLVRTLLGNNGDIRSTISDFVSWLGPFWSRHGDDIETEASESWTAIRDEIEDLLGQAKALIQGITGAISGDWEDFLDTLQEDFHAFDAEQRAEWESFMNGLRTTVGVVSDLIVLDWQSALDRVRGRTDHHANEMEGDWTQHTDKLRTIASAAYEIMKGDWSGALATIREDLLGWERNIFEIWDDFWAGIREKASVMMSTTGAVIKSNIDNIVEWFDDLPGRVLNALGDIGGAIADRFSFDIPGVSFSGETGGPGSMPGEGSTIDRLNSFMDSTGIPHRTTSTLRPGDDGFHGLGRAADFAGPFPGDMPRLRAIQQAWAPMAAAGKLKELIGPIESLNFKNGMQGPGIYPPNVVEGHKDHVHVAMHSGGRVTRNGVEPIKPDEVVAKLRAGETVRTREQESALRSGVERSSSAGRPIVLEVNGQRLAEVVRDELADTEDRNVDLGIRLGN